MIIEDIRLRKIRQRNKLTDMAQDLKFLAAGVLDIQSFMDGYRKYTDPVMVEVHDANGKLKARRYTHNLRTNSGTDWQSLTMGSGNVAFTAAYTAISATSVTATSTANAYLGMLAVIGGVYGVITANSGTVITVDQWYNPATQAVGTTPAATGTVTVPPGAAPSWYMALTTTNITPAVTDTALAGEITTPTGVARTQATYTHTTGNNSYQLQHQYTNNNATGGASVGPIYGAGSFLAASAGIMPFENTFTSATLAPGDQLTLSWTWTI